MKISREIHPRSGRTHARGIDYERSAVEAVGMYFQEHKSPVWLRHLRHIGHHLKTETPRTASQAHVTVHRIAPYPQVWHPTADDGREVRRTAEKSKGAHPENPRRPLVVWLVGR